MGLNDYPGRFSGRTAVVTGGASGVGREVAGRIVREGGTVSLWDVNADRLYAAGVEIRAKHTVVVDVTDPAAVARAAEAANTALGRIDILVASAGITGETAPVVEFPVESWKRVIDVNLNGLFYACRAVTPFMLANDYGRIVNVSSVAGKEGNPNASAYSASKAAVIGFTKSLGKELAHTGVRVNTITPATFESPILAQLPPSQIEYMKSKIPMGRLGGVEEVAALICWLAERGVLLLHGRGLRYLRRKDDVLKGAAVDRRTFVSGAAAGAVVRPGALGGAQPSFHTGDVRWQAAYDRACAVLAGNVQTLPRFDRPVLIEGASYRGIWMECGPHEALVYRKFRPDVARNGHLGFFALQRPDGQIPANIKLTGVGFGQIQMVVPIAATAWELAQATGDDELLHTAYAACARWDDWLMRWRDTRGTGLVEGFCTYDTGHDNSPRWAGAPNQCPDADAKRCAPQPGLPRLCPDLSATTYGARVALAAMAQALGRAGEADRWREAAERIRGLILSKLYVAADAAFYDLDAEGRYVKIDCDVLSRVVGEHVVDQPLFDELWARQLHDPKRFWAPYPLPSVALDDPLFVRPIPPNSWGGAAQALTALRAGRWFDHYGRTAEFGVMMGRWCEAIQRDPSFRQQLDPLTGEFTQADAPAYSPAALVMVDFTWRLAGVREEADRLEWTVRPGHPAARSAEFALPLDGGGQARMRYDSRGAGLELAGRRLGRLEGGAARLVTDKAGRPRHLVGVAEQPQQVALRLAGGPTRRLTLAPNQRVDL